MYVPHNTQEINDAMQAEKGTARQAMYDVRKVRRCVGCDMYLLSTTWLTDLSHYHRFTLSNTQECMCVTRLHATPLNTIVGSEELQVHERRYIVDFLEYGV